VSGSPTSSSAVNTDTAATHVLYVMYGMPSCYNNGFAFARRFMEDGISITVACDQDVSDLAANANVPFRHLKSLSRAQTVCQYREITQPGKRSRLKKLLDLPRILRECRKLRLESLENEEYLQLVQELNPDVLLIDIECHLAIIASSTLSIPTAICTRLFNHRPGDGVAPLHSHLLPCKQRTGRLRIAFQWWKLRFQSQLIAVRQSFSKQRIMPVYYRSFSMPDVKAIARQYQVDLSSIATTAHWFRPLSYVHVPILSMTLGDIDFERSKTDEFHYLGPMIGEQDFAFNLSLPSVEELDLFIERAKQDQQSIIYCAMGTYAQNNPEFIDQLRMLARLRDDCAFIISHGGREPVVLDNAYTENVLQLKAAPQIQCLANSDAAILHGGIASLQEALKYRVPVMCFSVGSNDQNGTVARWIERKLAVRFSGSGASTPAISETLRRMLDDKELSSRLEHYGQLLDNSVNEFSPKKIIRDLCTQ